MTPTLTLAALCLLATAPHPDRVLKARYIACMTVANRAVQAGHDPVLFVSLAVEESNLRTDAVSSRGAVGPLQVLPARCPGGKVRGCDLVGEGLEVAKRWQARFGDGWLCHYNAGKECGPRAHRYARRIERRAASWRTRLEWAGEFPH